MSYYTFILRTRGELGTYIRNSTSYYRDGKEGA
jgi:hypothetical protein